MPRAAREGLDEWWDLRVARGQPLLTLMLPMDDYLVDDATVEWLMSLAGLAPLVRVAVFCRYEKSAEVVRNLRMSQFTAVDRLSKPNTGLEGDGGDAWQSIRAMASHIEALEKEGSIHPSVFYGAIARGATFPDGQGLIDTLYGIAADIKEGRLPSAVALLGRGRLIPSPHAGAALSRRLQRAVSGSPEWKEGYAELQALPLEPRGAMGAVIFTPGAVEWDIHGGLAVSAPEHIGAMIRARRRAFARAADPGHRTVAAMGAVTVVDITASAPVLRLPLRWATFGPPPALLDGEGRPMPAILASEAELETVMEPVEYDGEEMTFRGHVVAGWRGPVADIVQLDAAPTGHRPKRRSPSGKDKGGAGAGGPAEKGKGEAAGKAEGGGGKAGDDDDDDGDAAGGPAKGEDKMTPVLSVFTTLFDVDKSTPEGLQKYLIQRNTLAAFAALAPDAEATVFTDSERVEAMCDELPAAVKCSRDFDSNAYGTPLLKSMYQSVEAATTAPVYGFLNADIIFDARIVDAVRTVLRGVADGTLSERVLIIGRRTNFQMPFPLQEGNPWLIKGKADLDKVKRMAGRGHLFQTDAEDFFFIRRGSFRWDKIHDFVIGRLAYDNWLVDHAYHDGLDRVDVSRTVHAVHQTGHDGNKAGHKKRPDTDWNKDLAKLHGGGYDHGHTHHANWETQWHSTDAGKVMQLRSRPMWHSKNRPAHLAK